MTGLLLALLLIAIVNLSFSSTAKENIRKLTFNIYDLTDEIKKLKKEVQHLQDEINSHQEGYSPTATATAPSPSAEEIKPETAPAEPEPLSEESPEPEYVLPVPELVTEEPIAAFSPAGETPHAQTEANEAPESHESFMQRWMRNNPDLEKFIGENLINKIGIAILVLGIAFFVKYAIDKEWINEAGRVSIGIGCGAILVGLAHYLRNSYRSFSSVLAGGGIAVFYFTIAFAFHQYQLLSQTAAFVIMVIITAFAVTLSVLYNKLELAVIAAIGGFITPFLLSTGEGNYIVLFTYLIILNIGLLSLAWFKRWTPINIIALFFTAVIYGGWLGTTLAGNKPISYPGALLFATAFYIIFLGMNMIHQVKHRQSFKAFDFLLLLFISFSYYSAGMIILHHWNHGAYQGFFTLVAGFINLGLAYYVFKKGATDKNLLFLLIGLTLTFLTLTIPIQLHGHTITLFWSAEFVLLYWLSVYSGIRMFRYSSAIVCTLSLISLLMDWGNAASIAPVRLLVIYHDLRGIVTNVVAIAAFAGYYFLLRRNKDEEYLAGIRNNTIGKAALSTGIAILYLTCIFGVNLFFNSMTTYDVPNAYHRLITGIFALAFIYWMKRYADRVPNRATLIPLVACYLLYLFSTQIIVNLRNGVLTGRYAQVHIVFHWAACIALCALFVVTINNIRSNKAAFENYMKPVTITLSAMIVIFLSIELSHVYIIARYQPGTTDVLARQYGKAGLTVVWAVCSFALMWLGMRHQQKVMRIISLVLFAVVLLKLFIFDIAGISEGGKILAFILLGVLLLTVSFMYQKLKKIIFDDAKK